jgi:hypothetical protein
VITYLKKLTPLALGWAVILILIGFGFNLSRWKLLFSGEVPLWRLGAFAALFVFLAYCGAALTRGDLLKDARKSRRR